MRDDQIRYQDALPKAPDSFMERMRDEIERMDEQMVRRHKTATMLVVALIFVVLIAGAAIAAANSDLLGSLFPNGAPPEAAQLLVTDNLSDEKDGLKLTVKEHLYDGRNFHLTWAVESMREDAVYVATQYRMLDAAGEPIEISYWNNRKSSMDQVGNILKALNVPVDGAVTPKSYEGYTSNGFLVDEIPTGPWTYTLDIYVYSSDLTPVALEGYTDDLTDGQILTMEKAGQFGIEMEDSLVYLYRYPAYQEALDDSDWTWSSRAKARVAAIEQCGLLTPLSHLSVTINMDPEAASVVNRKALPSPTTLECEDLTVKVYELEFDLTGTHAAYEMPVAAGEFVSLKLDNLFLILDQDGRMLNWVLSEGSCMWTPIEDEDGEQKSFIVEQGGGVPESVPQSVRLIRGTEELQALLKQYDFDEALKLWQKEGADWEEMRLELE